MLPPVLLRWPLPASSPAPTIVNATVYRGGPYYLESVTWGSTDLLHDPLVLDSSGAVPPIDVVVREGAATLSGTVLSGDSTCFRSRSRISLRPANTSGFAFFRA